MMCSINYDDFCKKYVWPSCICFALLSLFNAFWSQSACASKLVPYLLLCANLAIVTPVTIEITIKNRHGWFVCLYPVLYCVAIAANIWAICAVAYNLRHSKSCIRALHMFGNLVLAILGLLLDSVTIPATCIFVIYSFSDSAMRMRSSRKEKPSSREDKPKTSEVIEIPSNRFTARRWSAPIF